MLNIRRMEEMKRLLSKKVTVINEFDIDIEKTNKRNQQKKDLHGPRGVQSFW